MLTDPKPPTATLVSTTSDTPDPAANDSGRRRPPHSLKTNETDPPRPILITIAVAWNCGRAFCKREKEYPLRPDASAFELKRLVRDAQEELGRMSTFRCPQCPQPK